MKNWQNLESHTSVNANFNMNFTFFWSKINHLFCRGTTWILPSRHLNEVICEVSTWAQENPQACCYSPMVIQIFRSTQDSQLGN